MAHLQGPAALGPIQGKTIRSYSFDHSRRPGGHTELVLRFGDGTEFRLRVEGGWPAKLDYFPDNGLPDHLRHI